MYFINPNLSVIISPPDEKCGLTIGCKPRLALTLEEQR